MRIAAFVSLIAAGAASPLAASFQPDLGEGARLEAVAPVRTAALQRFGDTGELAVEAGGRRTVLPPAGQAAKFMKTCRFG
jgi:hypothetical protein